MNIAMIAVGFYLIICTGAPETRQCEMITYYDTKAQCKQAALVLVDAIEDKRYVNTVCVPQWTGEK